MLQANHFNVDFHSQTCCFNLVELIVAWSDCISGQAHFVLLVQINLMIILTCSGLVYFSVTLLFMSFITHTRLPTFALTFWKLNPVREALKPDDKWADVDIEV